LFHADRSKVRTIVGAFRVKSSSYGNQKNAKEFLF
jgi:hypothetical protein